MHILPFTDLLLFDVLIKDEEASVMPTYKRQLSAVALTNAQDSLTSSQINSINDSFDDLDVFIAHGLYNNGIETYLKSNLM